MIWYLNIMYAEKIFEDAERPESKGLSRDEGIREFGNSGTNDLFAQSIFTQPPPFPKRRCMQRLYKSYEKI